MRMLDERGQSPAWVQVLPLPQEIARHGAAFLVVIHALPGLVAGGVARGRGLTPAEREVAAELLSGARPKQISAKRGVSHETVRTQIRNIYAKLGTRSRFELFAHANSLKHPAEGPGRPRQDLPRVG